MLSLDGAPFLTLLAIITLALFAGVIVLWPRLGGSGVKPVAGRVGLFAVAQLSALALFAALVNADFEFYASWSDLFGTLHPKNTITMAQPSPVAAVASAGGNVSAVPGGPSGRNTALVVDGKGGSALLGGSDPKKYGQIQYVKITGPRSGLTQNVQIYLPPQYFQPKYENLRFPAALVPSGFPGSADEMSTRLRFPARLLAGIQDGADRPVVLIMLTPMIVSGRDTECTDVPGGPQALTFWVEDIPTAVQSAYRVQSGARYWGVVGDSTGGYCAVKIPMLYSDRFAAGASISGYFAALQDSTTGTLYGDSQDVRNENDLMWRIRHLPSPPVSLFLTASRQGDENYSATMQFVGLAKPPTLITTDISDIGGHNFNTWYNDVPDALKWLTNTLAPAQ
ncbi:hypothetical protein KGA66_20600 [Actinocrinis puniceicyclus]|uniref:Esterase n=1 Tax=Actinocrinis puniceicyclus TaxID=977794 RepID=A0A8J7WUN3_9ACTN|nr:alpha/beta hydrolase-fold protein [Actinocrinis puniceicyclus]MBS2965464.1 hypothetical protein [Actinocrinis puniceicyclus]